MSASVDAVIIAIVGVLGTLAAAIVSPLLAARARREDFKLQKMQREEEYTHQEQELRYSNKRSCYIAMMASARHYRVELMNYLELVNRKKADSSARDVLEGARRDCLTSLAEIYIIAPLRVLSTVDPVNSCLAKAYRATKNLEAGEPEADGSFEEITQSLEELWDQWLHMGSAMRHDLGIED